MAKAKKNFFEWALFVIAVLLLLTVVALYFAMQEINDRLDGHEFLIEQALKTTHHN